MVPRWPLPDGSALVTARWFRAGHCQMVPRWPLPDGLLVDRAPVLLWGGLEFEKRDRVIVYKLFFILFFSPFFKEIFGIKSFSEKIIMSMHLIPNKRVMPPSH
jgi:hypothetical protein